MSARAEKGPRAKEVKSAPDSIALLKPFSFADWDYRLPELGVAEKRAQLHDDLASKFPKQAREERELAEWWRKLLTFPGCNAKSHFHHECEHTHYLNCEHSARDEIDALLARASKFDGPFIHLHVLLDRIVDGLHALAAHGNPKAAATLTGALYQAVNNLEILATQKPETFRDRARKGFGFPGIISPNVEKIADNARLVKQLQVGKEFQLATLPTGKRGQKWKFQKPANALASRLQSYIDHHRILYAVHANDARRRGKNFPAGCGRREN